MNKEVWEIVGNGKLMGSVRKETIAVSDTIKISVQNRHSRIFLQDLPRSRMREMRNPSGKMARLLCKDYLKGTCTTPFCEKWHPLECLFYKSESGCRFGEKCSYAHRQVEDSQTKGQKIMATKVQLLC